MPSRRPSAAENSFQIQVCSDVSNVKSGTYFTIYKIFRSTHILFFSPFASCIIVASVSFRFISFRFFFFFYLYAGVPVYHVMEMEW